MSVGSEVSPEVELSDEHDIIQKQRWFFVLLSDSQAETILNEGNSWKQVRASKLLVSSLPSSRDYRISIRHHESRRIGEAVEKATSVNNVEHIIISYNEEDQSYGIEGEDSRYQSVVEVLQSYVASRDYVLEPFSGSLEVKGPRSQPLMSLTSIESSQLEEPPAYTTAMQYPTDKRPLPQIKTKLDPNKAQEAKLNTSFRSSSTTGSDRSKRGCCFGACDSGYDPYSFEDAGWLRCICLGIGQVIWVSFIVIFCGCCLIVVAISLLACTDKGFCDKCGPWCGCESFCEEHCVCCDDD